MKNSPVIYHYLKKYQQDPKSRVFAPLAEAYRKAGLLDEAIDIAREGLKVHPGFVGGKVALARALFDKKEFEEVIHVLQSVIQDVPDNILAQRLVGDSALMLGRLVEALTAYKMVLYFHPEDEEIARLISELESQAYEGGTLVLQTDPPAQQPKMASPRPEYSEALPEHQKWIRKIEVLQTLLLRLQRSEPSL